MRVNAIIEIISTMGAVFLDEMSVCFHKNISFIKK